MPLYLCLLLVALPLSANAEEEPAFGTLDRDRDGQLSPREVAELSLNFAALDKNDNGYLSRGELQQQGTELHVMNDHAQHAAGLDGATDPN